MSQRDLKQSVSSFFTKQSLPESRASRLSALASAAEHGARSSSAARRWPAFAGLLVVCVVITALVTTYLVRPGGETQGTVVEADRQDARKGQTTVDDGERIPRLVAVSTRADWCPMCPRMQPVYRKLVEEYGQRPVLFVVFDITDEAARKQTEYLAKTLGIDWLCKEQMPTGTIKLIDREKHLVLASVARPDQLDELTGPLDEALQ